jgi:hypothetical protein
LDSRGLPVLHATRRSTSTVLTTSGKALPKIAAMGTITRQLNITKMRNANKV